MATYYVDLDNGLDTQTGQAPVVKTGCVVTSGSAVVTVPSNTGIVSGMRCFSTDLNNSGALLVTGVTVSSISGTSITLSSQALVSSASATLVFSPALKTITAAYGKIGAGDTIRLKSSRTYNTGLIGNWVNKSTQLSFTGTAPYKIIEQCESAWSNNGLGNGAGVSASGTRVQGNNIAQFTMTSWGTNNGVVAYKTLVSPVDLSGFGGVSFMCGFGLSSATAGSVFLDLCSDDFGQVPVFSAPFYPAGSSATSAATGLVPRVFYSGSSINTTIRSVALRRTGCTVTNGGTLQLDNIVAVKAALASDYLDHNTVIAQSDSAEWWPIISFEPTYISLGMPSALDGPGSSRGYYGTTGTFPIYALNLTTMPTTVNATVTASSSQRITVSGGWSVVDMSTRTGETGISYDFAANVLGVASNYVFENFVHYRMNGAFAPGASSLLFRNTTFIGRNVSAIASGMVFDSCYFLMPNSHCFSFIYNITRILFRNCKFLSGGSAGSGNGLRFEQTGGAIGATAVELVNCLIGNNTARGIDTGFESYGLTVRGGKIADNDTAQIAAHGNVKVIGTEIVGTLPFTFSTSSTYLPNEDDVRFHNYSGVLNDHRIFHQLYNISTESTVRHTASGIGWKIQPISTLCDSRFPVKIPVGQVLCAANIPVQASIWLMRNTAALSLGIRVKGGQIAGVTSDIISKCTGPANQWEQVTLTFTPTVVGVVEFEVIAYGGTGNTGYLDDFSVSQSV